MKRLFRKFTTVILTASLLFSMTSFSAFAEQTKEPETDYETVIEDTAADNTGDAAGNDADISEGTAADNTGNAASDNDADISEGTAADNTGDAASDNDADSITEENSPELLPEENSDDISFDADADDEADVKTGGDSDGKTDGDSDGKTDGDSDGDSDGKTDGDSDGKTDGDSDDDSDTETISLSDCQITLSRTSYTYTGSARKPGVSVTYNGTAVSSDNYIKTYENNTNAGTASVILTGTNGCTGTVTVNFTIKKASQTIAVSPISSMIAGNTADLNVSGKGSITYSSTDSSVASVSANGTISALSAGTATIKIRAGGDENYKAGTFSLFITVRPAKPVISSASNTSSGICIKWNASAGAATYILYKSTDGGDYVKAGTSAGTSFTDKNVSGGSTYTYKIAAAASKDGTVYKSKYSVAACVRVESVKITNITPSSGKGVILTWTESKGAAGYIIYRSVNGGSFEKLKTVKASKGLSFHDTSASSKSKTYSYKIRPYASLNGTTYKGVVSSAENYKYNASNPIISYETDADGYSYTFTVNNTYSVSKIAGMKCFVWSSKGGQDDLEIYDLTGSGTSWTFSASSLSLKHYGTCYAHFYYTDKKGNLLYLAGTSFTVKQNVQISEEKTGAGLRTITVKGLNASYDSIKLGVWSETNSIDDLVWYTAERSASGNEFVAYFKVSNHKNSGYFNVHVYSGNTFVYGGDFTLPQSEIATKYTKLAQKLDAASETDQLVIVNAYGSKAYVAMLNKNDDGTWFQLYKTSGSVGSGGIGETTEWNRKTPEGTFDLSFAFGINENPGTALPYTQVDDTWYWVDDVNSPYYNQFVSTRTTPVNWGSAEHIIDYRIAYRYCIAIDYNTECVPGAGSAIFLHVGSSDTPTLGCVGISESYMIKTLQNIRPGCKIVIGSF